MGNGFQGSLQWPQVGAAASAEGPSHRLVGSGWLLLTWQATLSCFAKTEMHFCLINKTSDSVVCPPGNYATMGENARMVLEITVA